MAILFQDDFNRADSSTTLGSAWTSVDGSTWGISSNQGYCVSAYHGARIVTADPIGAEDYAVEYRVLGEYEYAGAVTRTPGLIFIFLDPNNWWYFDLSFDVSYLTKVQGGVFTDVETVPFEAVTGTWYDVKIERIGATINVYVDGASHISYTMTTDEQTAFLGQSTYAGFRNLVDGSGTAPVRFDDFSITGIGVLDAGPAEADGVSDVSAVGNTITKVGNVSTAGVCSVSASPKIIKNPGSQTVAAIAGVSAPVSRVRTVTNTLLSDDFARSDSATTLGSTSTGQAWTALAGTWGVSFGEAYSVTDAASNRVMTADIGAGDYVVSVRMKGHINGSNQRKPVLLFRGIDNSNWWDVDLHDNVVQLAYCDNGAVTIPANASFTTSDDTYYTLKVIANGDSIKVYVDNTLKITYTMSAGLLTKFGNAGRVGLGLWKQGTPTYAARWDDLKVQPLIETGMVAPAASFAATPQQVEFSAGEADGVTSASANPTQVQRVGDSQAVAESTVSGVSARVILTSTVQSSGESNVSATPTLIRMVSGAVNDANASVTGSAYVVHTQTLTGQTDGVSGVNATATLYTTASGQADGAATITADSHRVYVADGISTIGISAEITGDTKNTYRAIVNVLVSSDLTAGGVQVQRPVSNVVESESVMSATASIHIAAQPDEIAITAIVDGTATLYSEYAVSGTADGISAVSGEALVTRYTTAESAGGTSTSAYVNILFHAVGESNGQTIVAATPTHVQGVAGASAGQADLTASVIQGHTYPASGTVEAAGSAQAQPARIYVLRGNSTSGTSGASADTVFVYNVSKHRADGISNVAAQAVAKRNPGDSVAAGAAGVAAVTQFIAKARNAVAGGNAEVVATSVRVRNPGAALSTARSAVAGAADWGHTTGETVIVASSDMTALAQIVRNPGSLVSVGMTAVATAVRVLQSPGSGSITGQAAVSDPAPFRVRSPVNRFFPANANGASSASAVASQLMKARNAYSLSHSAISAIAEVWKVLDVSTISAQSGVAGTARQVVTSAHPPTKDVKAITGVVDKRPHVATLIMIQWGERMPPSTTAETTIAVYPGTSKYVELTLIDENGQPIDLTNCAVTWDVERYGSKLLALSTEASTIEVTDATAGKCAFHLKPEDTEGLITGSYVHTCRLRDAINDVYLVFRGVFTAV